MRFSVPLYDKMIKNLYGGICRTTLQLICSPRHVPLPQESACFSVTMMVLALETPFWCIVTEKAAYFCRTMMVLALAFPFWDIVTEKTACFCGTMPERRQRWPTISRRYCLSTWSYLRMREVTAYLLEVTRMLPPVTGKQHTTAKNPTQSLQFSKPLDKFVVADRKCAKENVMRYSLSLLSLLLWNRHDV